MASVMLRTPPETLIHTLSYLSWRELLSAQRISRAFQELIRSAVELQYIIELGADEFVRNDKDNANVLAQAHTGTGSGSSGLLTTQDKLTLLLNRRRSWRTLDFARNMSVRFPGPCFAHKLVADVFAKDGSGAYVDAKHFIAAWLPTRDDDHDGDLHTDAGGQQPLRMVRDDLPSRTWEFAMDPTQDLLAWLMSDESLNPMVHVRTLSSHETHPLAVTSPLVFPTAAGSVPGESLTEVLAGTLQIAGDIIGTVGECGGYYLRIWNWHTGVVLVAQSAKDVDFPTQCSLAFLSPRAYMIASWGDPGSLDLYEIRDSAASFDTTGPPAHVLSLRLPELRPHRKLDRTITHFSPYLTNPEALLSSFVKRQDARIQLVHLQYGNAPGPLTQYAYAPGPLTFTLHVKNEMLLDLMAQVREGRGVASHCQRILVPTPSAYARYATSGGAPDALPPIEMYQNVLAWEWWGPRYTRFLQQDDQLFQHSDVNGHRAAFCPGRPTDTKLCIFDFNVHPKRTDDPCNLGLDNGDEENRRWTYEVHTEETVLLEQDLFVAPVISSLPYAVSRRTDMSGYDKFLIDDQRLVGVKHSSGDAQCDIDVFTL
ncbi:hypothetical protein BDW22DRAFT_1487401 [Trametopsis cervina]|nr:hypothetical protein BDW22DRAFT_1487401 [Trametopsis cervina]